MRQKRRVLDTPFKDKFGVTESGKLITLINSGIKDSSGKDIYEGDILFYVGTNLSEIEVKIVDGVFVGEGAFNTLPLIDFFNAIDFEYALVERNIYEKQA